jgi:hypothetical protein
VSAPVPLSSALTRLRAPPMLREGRFEPRELAIREPQQGRCLSNRHFAHQQLGQNDGASLSVLVIVIVSLLAKE